mgnify:CR=1 FL=1
MNAPGDDAMNEPANSEAGPGDTTGVRDLDSVSTGAAALVALRRARQRRRLGELDWFEVAYRVYLMGGFGGGAVLWISASIHDRTAAADTVASLGYRVVRIEAPGTLDGGDVLKVGDTIYVGRGGRTNTEGIAQLAAAFEPLGATVITVPLTKVLHLKSAVTALPDGTIIGWEPAVDDVSVFPSFVAMPEEGGAHVVLLDDRRLLMSADCPQSAALLRARGYETVEVDISEYVKLEGCVTCLSVRLRDAPAR